MYFGGEPPKIPIMVITDVNGIGMLEVWTTESTNDAVSFYTSDYLKPGTKAFGCIKPNNNNSSDDIAVSNTFHRALHLL